MPELSTTNNEMQDTHADKGGNAKNFFAVDHLKSDLKRRSVRGGAATLTTQAAKFVIHTASTMVLARLLTPQDYGLVAMVTAVVGFVALFKDMGLSMATIQNKDITHEQVSGLFWINVGISILLGVILCALAPVITRFYREPRLVGITLVLACTFLFSGLTVQHHALLRRQMRFVTLGGIEVASMAVGVAGAILMAYLGTGYWALVALPVSTTVGNMILVWYFCRWRPGVPRRGIGVRPLLRFGGHLTGFSLVNYFSRNLDNFLLGRYWGTEILGFYSKAYNIMMLPISQIRGPLESVAIPALSHLQGDPERYRRYYLKLIGLVAFLSMPLMVFLFVCADEVILLLLGPNWSGASNIFKILCLVAFIQPVSSTRGLVLISLGKSQKYFRWGVANGVLTSASFVVGLPWGAVGVAVSYAASNYFILIPSLWYCFNNSPVSILDFLRTLQMPIIASVLMGIGVYCVQLYLSGTSAIISVILLFAASLFFYLSIWLIVPYGRNYLRELVRYKELFRM